MILTASPPYQQDQQDDNDGDDDQNTHGVPHRLRKKSFISAR